MSERELLNLIFLPGFSTADKVTQFSGRGVGMDVVRTNIEKIGGTVDIESRLGQGTTRQDEDPADAGHHPGPDRHQRRRPLRHPAGQPARTGPARRRAGPARDRELQENSCRPAVDVLFRSVAAAYGAGVLAVVLTGMGSDGLRGCERIREAGGGIVIQDEGIQRGLGHARLRGPGRPADRVLGLAEIGPALVGRVRPYQPVGRPV